MKVFSIKASEVTQAVEGLKASSLQDTKAFIPAGQLLKRIQQGSNGLKKDILATTLRIVAGQPCKEVLVALSDLRAAMKDAKAAGESSVGTVRAAVAALAARHGGDYAVPTWTTAAEVREAKKAAEAPVDAGAPDQPPGEEQQSEEETARLAAARMQAEMEELRAIAEEARRALELPADAPLAAILASLRTVGVSETVERITVGADGTAA